MLRRVDDGVDVVSTLSTYCIGPKDGVQLTDTLLVNVMLMVNTRYPILPLNIP
jgi:hypothetical protein